MHVGTDRKQTKQNGSRGTSPYPIYLVYPSDYAYIVETGSTSQFSDVDACPYLSLSLHWQDTVSPFSSFPSTLGFPKKEMQAGRDFQHSTYSLKWVTGE